ncbi:MAG: excinuclease ABC subunit UvrA [Planctomycetia bacterium]|nr:excinuclease ABC subunit UvrA [Planctomycetia bacterium]
MAETEIVIRGAREHNLRDVNLRLPKNQLIVMTGVSGSGKSSLAFDTLYAEGQRRYVESLSSYARQFLGQMPKPEVDSITGLSPSISIQQKTSGRNPRSTVGTITEIFDYLRVLFARVGQGHCTQCRRPITAQSSEQIIDSIALMEPGTRFLVLAPVIQRQKGEYRDLFEDLLKRGYLRARVDGRVLQLNTDIRLDKQMKHSIDVVVDRLEAGKSSRSRLAEAVEAALKLAEGRVVVSLEETAADGSGSFSPEAEGDVASDIPPTTNSADRLYSAHYACTHCGVSYEPPSPQLFSFNSPQGMCLECNGLGERFEFLMDLLIPDESLSLWNGAIELLGAVKEIGKWRRHIYDGVAETLEYDLKLPKNSVLKSPWNELPDSVKHALLFGTGSRHILYEWKHGAGVWKHGGTFDGLIPELLSNYSKTRNPARRKQLEKYMSFTHCSACGGTRLNKQARCVTVTTEVESWGLRVEGQKSAMPLILNSQPSTKLALTEVCALSIQDCAQFFEALELGPTEQLIACEVLKEIRGRLGFLLRCGLNYLTLDRAAPTLSGGESQRIRLAGQIGCGLVGVVYILDEPSIGLHPRDNEMLLGSLCDLRDQGNTVIVVEHDDETMRAADYLVDFGPGPGVRGGRVVAEGSYEQVCKAKESLTGQYLSGKMMIDVPSERRIDAERAVSLRSTSCHLVAQPTDQLPKAPDENKKKVGKRNGLLKLERDADKLTVCATEGGKSLHILGATHHNLRDVSVSIPLEAFVCVTGVSGSGKSSLVNDILWEVLNRDLNKGNGTPGAHRQILGLEQLDKAIDIDQSPIGRTPRSNPATYVKVFDLIRDLYTQLTDSKRRGYKPGRFSFNVSGGRCEACEGNGSNKLEMDFLADLWVTCPVCGGHRFNHETLEVKFKEKSIADVLELDVQQALEHFDNIAPIRKLLQTLHDVGLDYLKLGQPSPTLSGGEAQRIKLARELGKRSTGRTIYLLDEPTTGLHFADIHKLLDVLHGFVKARNTVLVVEHNLDVIKTADWVIDLGPEGGSGGGRIVCCGTPEEVAACDESHTGRALRDVLSAKPFASSRLRVSKSSEKSSREGAKARRTTRALAASDTQREITVRGASQHNLQHIDLTIPRDQMNVFCGPSGSGKSSLAMDTLYAEGQRRYVESLSSYARQFLGQMPKPRVEHIHGLSPAIAIEQKTTGSTPRSTVGTVTEIYDYLRLLWCRLGTLHCPDCGIAVTTQTTDEVIDKVLATLRGGEVTRSRSRETSDGAQKNELSRVRLPTESKPSTTSTTLLILAPQDVKVGEKHDRLWDSLKTRGFRRVRIDGTTYRLEEVPEIDRRSKHVIEVVVDRVKGEGGLSALRSRLAGSIEQAFDLGRGLIRVAYVDDNVPEEHWRVEQYSLRYACEQCGRSFEELTPYNFSFNSPLGWCPTCEGLGVQQGTDLAALVHEPKKSLADGAVTAWPDVAESPLFRAMLEALAQQFGIPLDVSFERLDPRHKRIVLHGTGDRWIEVSDSKSQISNSKSQIPNFKFRFQYKGLYPAIEEAGRVSYSYRHALHGMTGEVACSACSGSRLRDDAANVRFRDRTLQQVSELPLSEAETFLKSLKLTSVEKKIAGDLLHEATSRVNFLVDVGLTYLSLARTLPTLSGGECQRIRLAGQIGRALTGVLYVLDEPTIGLHPRDNGRLLSALKKLRDLGNTLVLVEHDREVLGAADRLYDFGPGAGRLGGTITAEGSPKQLGKNERSMTGAFLSGRREIAIPVSRRMASQDVPAEAQRRGEETTATNNDLDSRTKRTNKKSAKASSPNLRASAPLRDIPPPGGGWLELTGARHNNLRNVHLRIPLGTLTVVTGVSGSGKSSLIQETLAKALARAMNRVNETPGPYDELIGLKFINKLIVVDQQPLGSTPKSNPGTYTGVFDEIRELFTQLPESKVRGWRPGRFSFNRPGGRCEACEGNGQKMIEMHFLPDVWIECDQCRGKRYNSETLAVKYRSQSISDVLDMPIGKALELFENIPKIRGPLATLCAVGLDYLTLGQSAPTLSGGEAQRVKLAAELARPQTGKTLYILDEPTTGLHFDDIDKLLKVLNSLVEKGNSVVVIEHNLDVIKTADWIIDLGPEAGDGGGWIVAEGTPEDVVRSQLPVVSGKLRKSSLGAKTNEQRTTDNGHFSHTAAALAPILATGIRSEREFFDADAVRKKKAGDVTTSELGRDAKMPWQINGRKWHLEDRLAHNSKPCRWEGAALRRVIDFLEADLDTTVDGVVSAPLSVDPSSDQQVADSASIAKKRSSRAAVLKSQLTGKLAGKLMTAAKLEQDQLARTDSGTVDSNVRLATNWGERSVVEVIGPDSSRSWFLHALTGDEWLLSLKFRVPEGTFQQKSLAASLNLKPVDDIREIEAYGRGERVRVKDEATGAWQEVVISVHWLREIDTPEFWIFLGKAKTAFLSKSRRRWVVAR